VFSSRHGFGALLLLATSTLAACAGGPDPNTAAPSHMFAHFMQVGVIQSAIVSGDVGATRGPARWLASHQAEQFPAAAEPALEQMRAEARIILAQDELTEIARSLARMGTACGNCHRVTDGGPHLKLGEAPPLTSAPEEHMNRHIWAVDRLWEGIIGPSDASWAAGAAALVGAPLTFGAGGATSDQADQLARKVHDLATRATAATDPKDRAAVYGELLQTCTLCHEALGLHTK
jgi:cytochrome c556